VASKHFMPDDALIQTGRGKNQPQSLLVGGWRGYWPGRTMAGSEGASPGLSGRAGPGTSRKARARRTPALLGSSADRSTTVITTGAVRGIESGLQTLDIGTAEACATGERVSLQSTGRRRLRKGRGEHGPGFQRSPKSLETTGMGTGNIGRSLQPPAPDAAMTSRGKPKSNTPRGLFVPFRGQKPRNFSNASGSGFIARQSVRTPSRRFTHTKHMDSLTDGVSILPRCDVRQSK